jgi:hypothetical protein
MRGFGMIIGSAMSGWSEGKLSQIKAERDARMKELEEARQDRRLKEEREFRSREAEIGRGFEAGEREKDRAATVAAREDTQSFQSAERKGEQDFRAGESDKERGFRREERQSDQMFRSGEGEKDRGFRKGEREAEQGFTAGEKQKDREFQGSEKEKDRAATADVMTTESGETVVRSGDKVKPLTDEKGNKVKLASATKDKPAEVSTAEWLIQQGVAKDAADAWGMVRSARADPEKSRASIYKAWLDALTKGQLGTPDPAELEKAAREATEKTLEYLESEGGTVSTPQTPAKASPQGTDEAPANVIPSDPAKRVVGKVYVNKSGQQARWTGNGWQPLQ